MPLLSLMGSGHPRTPRQARIRIRIRIRINLHRKILALPQHKRIDALLGNKLPLHIKAKPCQASNHSALQVRCGELGFTKGGEATVVQRQSKRWRRPKLSISKPPLVLGKLLCVELAHPPLRLSR